MARAYQEIRLHGVDSIYRGTLGRAIVDEARNPSTAPGVSVPKGQITLADLAAYRALDRAPTHARYRGLDVYGMGVPSSGGIAVGEILNLLEAYDQRTGRRLSEVSNAEYLHRFSEASAARRMLSADSLSSLGQPEPLRLPYTLVAKTVFSRRPPPCANQLPMIS
jgi:gamma-glutamyltranspeptidase/glutathione hydrolase